MTAEAAAGMPHEAIRHPREDAARRLPRVAFVASRLRSAIGRASERLKPASPGVMSEIEDDAGIVGQYEDNQADEAVVSVREVESCGDAVIEAQLGNAEGLALGDATTEAIAEPESFVVHVEETPPSATKGIDVSSSDELDVDLLHDEKTHAKHRVRWTVRDVLLQPDSHGLGLNLALVPRPRHFPTAAGDKKSAESLVVAVASFRRLYVADIGPAEACQQIRVGDLLSSIDGEGVSSLRDIQTSLRRAMARENREDGFVLMRFLRPEHVESTEDAEAAASMTTIPVTTTWTPGGPIDENNESVAMLIRELVIKNQRLEEQLIASQLKQDEQRIQLEQLHALYARTQLETWSSFSLPKPLRPAFARRASSSVVSNGAADGSTRTPSSGSGVISAAAARLMGTSASPHEIEFAVAAERDRLLRQFQKQREAETCDLRARYDARLDEMRVTTEKKLRMLERGVHELLEARAPSANELEGAVTESASTPQVSKTTPLHPHVQLLRHRLLHHKAGDHPECVLCLLVYKVDEIDTEEAANAVNNQVSEEPERTPRPRDQEIIEILQAYLLQATMRRRKLHEDVVFGVEKADVSDIASEPLSESQPVSP